MWAAIIAGIVAVIGIIANSINQNQQETSNEHLAQFQATKNLEAIDKQNMYNSPAKQMERYQAAGLNPHLIYGQGSPGNQASAPTFPNIGPVDLTRYNPAQSLEQGLQVYNQARMADAQIGALRTNSTLKEAQTQVARLQALVIQKNPLLDDDGFKAIIQGLQATAAVKEEQASGQKIRNFVASSTQMWDVSKVKAEVEYLEQRFKLGQQDEKIKAEILKSKEFQNAILEVQKRFLADGNVGPQQIMQFITLLLTKAL